MTFLEAALKILSREGRPLHFKELTERAMTKKLLTFVGRTPEVTMQTQLTAAVKKTPGNPFVRVKPGVFGLLRYPELTAEGTPITGTENYGGAIVTAGGLLFCSGTRDAGTGRAMWPPHRRSWPSRCTSDSASVWALEEGCSARRWTSSW